MSNYFIDALCYVSSAAVGSSSTDIAPEIIIPPTQTSCIESLDHSVKMECVANARLSLVIQFFCWHQACVKKKEKNTS